MDEFTKLFSTVMTPARMQEARMQAMRSFERDLAPQSKNLKAVPPDPATKENPIPFKDDNSFGPDQHQYILRQMRKGPLDLQHPPPATLRCANVHPAKYFVCKNQGTSACSVCKLVSYCSKECQRAHWKEHKPDCKNSMMSTDWKPSWILDSREPLFLSDEDNFLKDRFSQGMSLWGNTPATDVISLARNGNNPKQDLSLAFIASGDLRCVLRSFNALPSNYSGHLNILVNDFNPFIFCRNVVLLLILGNIPDETLAADMALHFWYSAFLPGDYRIPLSGVLLSFVQDHTQSSTFSVPLGPRSKLSTTLSKEDGTIFSRFISSDLSIDDIQKEYDRIRTAPSRHDYRDRMYAKLKLSHRIAFQQYRRFGIVLPFGAMNAHFNTPNPSLFSSEGKWLQTDFADPLEGWDIPAIVNAGKAHGALPEDIYGCLYFFLLDQLRMFAGRLRRFSSSFTVFHLDARALSHLIRENECSQFNIPSSIKFDRIDVSNILDENYVGLHDVLTLWGPLLGESKNAAIVGYFMNWTKFHKAGRASHAGRRVMGSLMEKLLEKEKSIKPKAGGVPSFTEIQAILHSGPDDIESFYENSQAFFKYLQSQNLDNVLKKTGLRLRDKHTIVPHRILAPLQGSPTALPEFPDDDTWYYYTKLTNNTWSERYVEFERK